LQNTNSRVIIVTNIYFPILGGITSYIKNLTKYLESIGCQSRVISYPHQFRKFETGIGPASLRRLFKLTGISLFIGYTLLVLLGQKAGGKRVVVHSINSSFCGIAAGLANVLLGYRCVHTFMTDLTEDVRVGTKYNKNMISIKIFDRFLTRMKAITFVSDYLRKTFEKHLQTRSINKNLVVHMSVDTGLFLPGVECGAIKRKYSLKSPVFLFMGHLIPRKAPDAFVEALIALSRKDIEYTALLIGKGPLDKKLKKMISSNNLDDRIHLVGEVSFEDVPAYHACSDIFVLPSLAEGLPTVILEAMSAESAVIATSVSGTPEAIRAGYNGLLIQPGDHNGLVQAMEDILKRNLYRKMGKHGRKMATNKFSWKSTVRVFAGLYGYLMINS